MIGKDSSLLGIDIHETEIRVVQVRSRGNRCTITKVGRAPLQYGAVVRGKVMYPASVAVALRLLLNSMEIGAGRAVVGVLGDTTALRTLPIPPVPEDDLPMVVAGEVEHYGLVRTEGGTHAFLRLHAPRSDEEEEKPKPGSSAAAKAILGEDAKPVHVTIVALEEDVIVSNKQTIEEANLVIDAIEPTQYAMLRSALSSAGPNADAFVMMVNPANTDIAIVYGGNLAAYRRIDIGSRAMLYNFPTQIEHEYSQIDPNALMDQIETYAPAVDQYQLENVSVENLSIEIQRTLDYYQREFPSGSIGDKLYLAIDDSRLDNLAEELSHRLGTAIEAVCPTAGGGESAETLTAISSTTGPIYAAAYGLAAAASQAKIARIDLFTKQRQVVKKAEAKRNFRGSILTSVLAVLLGLTGYKVYQFQIDGLNKQTDSTQKRTQTLKDETSGKLEKRHRQDEQYKALRTEGLPVTQIMDSIAAYVGKGTGLTSVAITPDLKISINGEAASNADMIQTLETLNQCPIFQDMGIVSFGAAVAPQTGVVFNISGKTISLDKVRLPGDAPAPGASKTAVGTQLKPAEGTPVKPPSISLQSPVGSIHVPTSVGRSTPTTPEALGGNK